MRKREFMKVPFLPNCLNGKASAQQPSDGSYGLEVFVAGQDPLVCFLSDLIDHRAYWCLSCIW